MRRMALLLSLQAGQVPLGEVCAPAQACRLLGGSAPLVLSGGRPQFVGFAAHYAASVFYR